VSCNSNNYSVFRPSDCMNRPESVGFAGKVQPTMLHFLRLHDTSHEELAFMTEAGVREVGGFVRKCHSNAA
jgi:hypothetical protein